MKNQSIVDRRRAKRSGSRWRSLALAGMSLVGLLALGSQARAATFFQCTPNRTGVPQPQVPTFASVRWNAAPTFRVNWTDFPPEGVLYNAILWALDEWNRGPQNLTLGRTLVDSTTLNFADTNSDIYRTDLTGCGAGYPACTLIFQSCADGILAADIQFQPSPGPGLVWKSSSTAQYFPYFQGGTAADARTVALHELGHALGLGHTNNLYSVMGDNWKNHHAMGTDIGLFTYPYVGADTSSAVRVMYGNRSGARPELSVSHWVYSKVNGAYSEHRFARVYPAGGTAPLAAQLAFAPTPTTCLVDKDNASAIACKYQVHKGQVVDAEFTYENNGAGVANDVTLLFKLSTDPTIDFGDRTLASYTTNFTTGPPSTLRHQLTLPGNLARGTTYYIGVIVDPSNAVQEMQEDPLVATNQVPPVWTGNVAFVPIFLP
jgi:hypothetical protein